jgi:hypothetical protein
MTNYLQAAGFTWAANGDATLALQYEGNVYIAKVPASSVRFELRKAARLEGMNLEALGDVDILGWFGGKIWRSAKKAVKKVAKSVHKVAKKVAKRALKTVKADALWRIAKRYGGKAAKWGLKAVQSKEFGALVAASALVCPAIGGPALAAYATANRAAWAVRQGGSAAKTITSNVRRIARGKRPTLNQRYLLSAFRSIAA